MLPGSGEQEEGVAVEGSPLPSFALSGEKGCFSLLGGIEGIPLALKLSLSCLQGEPILRGRTLFFLKKCKTIYSSYKNISFTCTVLNFHKVSTAPSIPEPSFVVEKEQQGEKAIRRL